MNMILRRSEIDYTDAPDEWIAVSVLQEHLMDSGT